MQRAWISAVTLVCASLMSVAPRPAQADVFKPIPSPPVIDNIVAPGSSVANQIQPKYPDSGGSPVSDGVFEVSATVSTNATLDALKSVTMCWYKASEGDTDCETLDPQYAFQMVWTESSATSGGTAGFSVSDSVAFSSNNYENDGSQVETTTDTSAYDETAQSMKIRFKFRVSNAMRAGSDWVMKLTALYDTELCAGSACPGVTATDLYTTSTPLTGRYVAYWGEITTSQPRIGFGVITEGGTSEVRTVNSFEYVANATSDYGMTGTDFYYDPNDEAAPSTSIPSAGADRLSLVKVASGYLPTNGQVVLECKAINPAGSDFVQIDVDGETLDASLDPTSELPEDTGEIDCKLTYGGGAAFALKIYSSVVTISILQTLPA